MVVNVKRLWSLLGGLNVDFFVVLRYGGSEES